MEQEKSVQAKNLPAVGQKRGPIQDRGLDEFIRRLGSEMTQQKAGQEKIGAALAAAQRVALQMDTDATSALAEAEERRACHSCGNLNPRTNRFCARCGVPQQEAPEGDAPAPTDVQLINPLSPAPGQHHYHHHYHHHYFSSSDGAAPAAASEPRVATATAPRPRTPGGTGPSRAEAAVRKVTQDWALACNTKHLDDLVDLYTSDATVLRSNVPPVRSTAAIREMLFAALEAGLGEVEMEPLRIEVFGELACDVGRYTLLAPTPAGKRREERGKYVLLSTRLNGEWKILVDCWSSDLSLGTEAGVAKPASAPTSGTRPPAKTV
jgi:uncharacterized protein (TIGR02246 family)